MTTRAKSSAAKSSAAKNAETKNDEVKAEAVQASEVERDEVKAEATKAEEMKTEEMEPQETKAGEAKAEAVKSSQTQEQTVQDNRENGAKRGRLLQDVLDELRKPFHPSQVTWKPGAVKGERALALAYADLRAYMNRLDEVCGSDWSVAYEPWGEDRLICRLTIMGVTRSSTGETTNESERSEIGGTVAEAQAFKRASAMFGLGRYLYNLPTGWADFDPATKRFTEKAKAKLTGILMQHYRRATDTKSEMADLFAVDNGHGDADGARPGDGATVTPELAALFEKFNALGNDLYGDQWDKVCRRNVQRISGGKAKESGELSPEQIQQLITGMTKLKQQRVPMTVAG